MLLIFSYFLSFSAMVLGDFPWSVFHDFHVSKCEIEYSSNESAIQISISLFIDDLELALSQEGHDSLRICTQKEVPEAEDIIWRYLNKHLKLAVDDVPLTLEWVGKEISEDLSAVWCYLQISGVYPQKKIFIQNAVLMHLYDDQQNLVKLTYSNKQKSFFLFDNSEYSGMLELNQ